jgi:hypothetical protein
MECWHGDWEPSVEKGSGEIRFNSPNSFEYTLTGMPEDIAYIEAAPEAAGQSA